MIVCMTLVWIALFAAQDRPGWKLAWSDEFNTAGAPDASKWDFEEGKIRNGEQQTYTRKNAWIENGSLVIEARKEGAVTSASLTSKANWKYGRIEVKAKLPKGRGTWPAIWMLAVDRKQVKWPACGEIDIMENVGFDPNIVHANIHTQKYNHIKGTNKGSKIEIAGPFEAFHVYAIEWSAEKIDFFADDKKYFTYVNDGAGPDSWPYDKPYYLILNFAVGGSWGGQKGVDDAMFPQRFLIDYVRVYQR